MSWLCLRSTEDVCVPSCRHQALPTPEPPHPVSYFLLPQGTVTDAEPGVGGWGLPLPLPFPRTKQSLPGLTGLLTQSNPPPPPELGPQESWHLFLASLERQRWSVIP